MARIRTIKPEYWTSEQVMECSPMARLLFIGLWNFCDDVGRMAMSPKRIKAQILPSDDVTSSDVLGMIQELEANGLITLYVVDGKEYLAVTGWKHQRIDKPQKALTPEPPDPNSPNDPGSFHVGKGREKEKEKEGEGSKPGGGGDPSPARTHTREAPTRHEALAEPEQAAVEPAGAAAPLPPTWNTRENFDRVERRCRAVLPASWVQDLVVGPMARLEADGLDLEREIVPALLDLAASRRSPIRTWQTLANAVAERVAAQRESRTSQGLAPVPAAPTPPEEMVDLPGGVRWPESDLRRWIARHRENPGSWNETLFGPPPGQPGCKIPPRLLLEAA